MGRRMWVVAAALVLCAGCGQTIQRPAVAVDNGDDRRWLTRVYDVRNLLEPIPSFDSAPDFHLETDASAATRPGLSFDPEPAEPTAAEMVESLIAYLKLRVLASWDEPPGIRELNGQLVIYQTAGVHRQINAALQQLRERRGRQATVETRCLTMPVAAIDELPRNLRTKLAETKLMGAGGVLFSDAEASELLRTTQRSEACSLTAAPRITLFDGQRAWLAMTTQQAYIKANHRDDKKKVNGIPQWSPDIGIITCGTILDASVAVGRTPAEVCAVDLRLQISNYELEQMADPVAPRELKLIVHRPKGGVITLHTMQQVPPGSSVVVDGGTYPPVGLRAWGKSPSTLPATGPGSPTAQRMFLIVKVLANELDDLEPERHQ